MCTVKHGCREMLEGKLGFPIIGGLVLLSLEFAIIGLMFIH